MLAHFAREGDEDLSGMTWFRIQGEIGNESHGQVGEPLGHHQHADEGNLADK
jgi:hypothetical protein